MIINNNKDLEPINNGLKTNKILEKNDTTNETKKDKKNDITTKEKKDLIKKINNLSELEMKEVFNLIKNKNIDYTSNSNGIFINLKNFDKDFMDEINNYIIYCSDNKEVLDNKILYENNLINNFNNNNIDLIYNFKEYENLEGIGCLNNVSLKKKKKKEINKFVNILKKYNRIYLNINDNTNTSYELSYDKYLFN